MKRLDLTDQEAKMLTDIVAWWVEGYEPATEDVMKDPSHESPERMLEAVGGMIHDHGVVQDVLQKLRRLTTGVMA